MIMADATLSDISKALGFSEKKQNSTESYFGTVVKIDPTDPSSYINERNGTYYYWVLIDGNDNPTECARLVNATADDRVLINVLQNGHSVVVSRIDGDLNANDAKAMAEATILYDHDYQYSSYPPSDPKPRNYVTFTAHAYRGGEDVTSEFYDHFYWGYKTENSPEEITIPQNHTEFTDNPLDEFRDFKVGDNTLEIRNLIEKVGYGLHIIGKLISTTDQTLQSTSYENLRTVDNQDILARTSAEGESIRVRDLEVITNLSSLDKVMVVTESEENLVTVQTLSDVVDKHYTHEQDVVSDIWTIQHNLNKMPSVVVVDSGGSTVEGDISYIDFNTLTISFNGAFTGKAYCN